MTNASDNPLYPISTVSEMTGVNSITLRAWERRYGMIEPLRTDSGHRMYSRHDIERIKRIVELVEKGVPISRISDSLIEQRTEDEAHLPRVRHELWKNYIKTMLKATSEFDEQQLNQSYAEAMSLFPVETVTKELLLPLLRELGRRWDNVCNGIAEEHFVSVFIRNKLGARFHHRNLTNTGPKLVAACLPGEQHEFGLLLFSLAAHAYGYRIILLGANMPLEGLPEVVRQTRSSGIVLSGSEVIHEASCNEAIFNLTEATDVPVFIGGSYAKRKHTVLEGMGVHAVGDDLNHALNILTSVLPDTSLQA